MREKQVPLKSKNVFTVWQNNGQSPGYDGNFQI